MDCANCALNQRVNSLEKKVDDHIKSSRESHKEMYTRLNRLEANDAARNEQYNNILGKIDTIQESIDDIKKPLDELRQAPAKRYDKLVWSIISAITTGVLGYIIGIMLG